MKRLTTNNLAVLERLAASNDFYAQALLDGADNIAALEKGTEGPVIVVDKATVGANIVLASCGLASLDGAVPTAGMLILVKDQNTASENGIYVASATAWKLLTNPDGTSVLADGLRVAVKIGTLNANTSWTMTNGANYTFISTPIGTFGVAGDMAAAGVAAANSAGVSAKQCRIDHVHAMPFSAVNTALAAANAPIAVNSQKITSLLDGTAAKDAAAVDQLPNVITAAAVRTGAGVQDVTINIKDPTGVALGSVDVDISARPTTDGTGNGTITTGSTGTVVKANDPATGAHSAYCSAVAGVLVVHITDPVNELVFLRIEASNAKPLLFRVTTAA
jgi:hypothetical protein